jgi:hypothetical protein
VNATAPRTLAGKRQKRVRWDGFIVSIRMTEKVNPSNPPPINHLPCQPLICCEITEKPQVCRPKIWQMYGWI